MMDVEEEMYAYAVISLESKTSPPVKRSGHKDSLSMDKPSHQLFGMKRPT